MGATAIQWTDATWNPVTGCQKVSPGYKHCYAEGVAERFWPTQYPPVEVSQGGLGPLLRPRRFTDVQVHPDRLEQPLQWQRPRRIFVNSMSDLFHEAVPDEFIARVFVVMARANWHTFQVLTKRPERMREWMGWHPAVPSPNVWLGVSVEDQERADERVPLLLDTPAAVRFLSCEPLLGTVDLSRLWRDPDDRRCNCLVPAFEGAGQHSPGCACFDVRLDWLIVGGESGAQARPMDLAWARSLVAQGQAAGVPVFVKQLGRRPSYAVVDEGGPFSRVDRSLSLRDSHGGDIEEWPEDLQVREFPGAVRA